MAIQFGAVIGGPEVYRSTLWQAVQRAEEVLPDIPSHERKSFVLLLRLHIPGSVWSDISWSGIRTSSSSKEEKWAAIQAAVPAEIVNSPDAKRWLVETIRDAIPLCEKKCRRQKYPFDRELHERSLAMIENEFRVQRAT